MSQEQEQGQQHISVNFVYGTGQGDFEVPSGSTVSGALSNPYLREMIGVPQSLSDKEVVVDGKRVSGDYVLQSGQKVELIKRAGEKASA